ncbi:EAL domain-containing protein [Glaciecola petra]|uniref:EAL domain-containing protein n=1 Tax=Glaciecola petra TaxID=3075602 RepID=A0ABU2ZSZ9_9ALTE|nr:EAL domain-containing protein [Aestuariibacter sp. P117]MDT0595735.1 EAL domain-containing protein [Aestuariibacter sp. P117]
MNDLQILQFWQVLSIVLVISMQIGFLMLEAGAVRSRNSINVAQKNIADFIVCWIVFFILGYSVAFGLPSPIFTDSLSVNQTIQFVFNLSFCAATATIISGAVAERLKFSAYLVLTVFVAGCVFPISVALVWGNENGSIFSPVLALMGFVDFAGGTVVHVSAAGVALACVIIIGARNGRFNDEGKVIYIPANDPISQMLGCFIITVGWIGFNTGTLSPGQPEFNKALLNTLSACSFGGVAGMLLGYFVDRRIFDPNRAIFGILCGLVSSTAGAVYATSIQAIVTAIIAVAVSMFVAHKLLHKYLLDDPLDVVAIHGVAGVIGTIGVAFFLPEESLIQGSVIYQLIVQSVGSLGIFGLWFLCTWLFLKVYANVIPIRVCIEDEKIGLNYTEHGISLDSEFLKTSIKQTIIDEGSFQNSKELDVKVSDDMDANDIQQALNQLLSNQKKANKTIQNQSRRFLDFAATTNDLLWETDEQLNVTLLEGKQPSGKKINLLKQNVSPFFDSFQLLSDDIKACRDAMEKLLPVRKLEVKCTLLNDNVLQLSGIPFFDEDGDFKGYRGGGSDITEQKFSQQKADFLTNNDPLTQLKNRHKFANDLSNKQQEKNLGLMVIDVCSFREINESYGYEFGDALLHDIGRQLHLLENSKTSVYHLASDKFSLMISTSKDQQTLEKLIDVSKKRVEEIFTSTFFVNDKQVQIKVCVGICCLNDNNLEAPNLLRFADVALEKAKTEGPGTYIVFDQKMSDVANAQEQLVGEIETAFEENQFELYYQPKFTTASQTLTGFEALIRWNHPDKGVLSPFYFLDIVEKMNRLDDLGNWVFESVCKQLAELPNEQIRIAINVAPVQLKTPNFTQHLLEIANQYAVLPQRIELELLEEALLTSIDETRAILKKLRDVGFSIAIDDFGCGSTSLQYLYKLPATTLKIDRSFIIRICENNKAQEIAHSIVRMGRKLNMKVVAEGIETKEQFEVIRQWNCDEAQGYLFGKPMPVADMKKLILASKP